MANIDYTAPVLDLGDSKLIVAVTPVKRVTP